MGGGGGSDTTTTVQKADPWSGQQPYLTGLYQQAAGLPQQQPYPFPEYVPPSPATLQAQQAQTNRALQGNPLLGAAQQQNYQTTTGEYLHGGQGFNQALGAAQRQIIPGISSAFEQSGRYGSGLHQESLARGMGDAFAGLYDRERGRQQAATLAAPGLAQADYADIERLGAVGQQQEGYAGNALDAAIRRWQFQQQAPYQQAQAQSGIIQGGFPGGQSVGESSRPSNSPSPLAGAAGGALAGGALAGASQGAIAGPWGMAIGAGLGALGASSK